jgi:MFS family permease
MSPATLRLVILISCCHALVHVYELSFSSIEQLVGKQFDIGQATTGELGTYVGLPFGLFALAAGWLADHFGAKRLLLVFLFGCSATLGIAAVAGVISSLGLLGAGLFGMGTFAAIYHPAGVGLISHETRPENRPMALAYHGVFGSAGIAAGPFLAAVILATGVPWWGYLGALTVPGVLLAIVLMARFVHEPDRYGAEPSPAAGTNESNDEPEPLETTAGDEPPPAPAAPRTKTAPPDDENHSQWLCYAMLIGALMMAGLVYRAVLTFLPRYLDQSGLDFGGLPPEAVRNVLTGFVLVLGILGQFAAGWVARPRTLEPLMMGIFIAVAPVLLWMGLAEGPMRVVAAAVFAPLFFMHQPIVNSLVAKYTSRRRRSLAYGLSFTLGFGVGSFGSKLAGELQDNWGEWGTLAAYGTLAALAAGVALMAGLLWWRATAERPN